MQFLITDESKFTHGFTKSKLEEWDIPWPPPEGWKPRSPSQLHQDLFVCNELNQKRNGFFVEFGAADGRLFSNTYMLEDGLNWTGILAEPARIFRERLPLNRPRCSIDFRCVWKRSGELLEFSEDGELSTIAGEFSEALDISCKGHRIEKTRYQVETVSLNDLLSQHYAPSEIDYVSIDTEGSEYDILSAFDFDKYNVEIFTIEHGQNTPIRQKIYDFMTSKGYERKLEEYSGWDDWYVKERSA